MLRELDEMRRSKEEFMAEYTPIREAVEAFLKGGKKVNGNMFERGWSALTYLEFKTREFPYYLREVSGMLQGPSTLVRIAVKTEGVLYPYSKDIETSFIMVTAEGESDSNGPVAVLPPVIAFKTGEVGYKNYLDTPDRLSGILPLLRGS